MDGRAASVHELKGDGQDLSSARVTSVRACCVPAWLMIAVYASGQHADDDHSIRSTYCTLGFNSDCLEECAYHLHGVHSFPSVMIPFCADN